ncbi:MAG: hypothetical protein ACKO7W_14975 [Elainella sp.]
MNRSTSLRSRLQTSTFTGFSRNFFDDLFGTDAGDSQSTARKLGTLRRSSSFNRSGTVGRDDNDFFSFKLGKDTSGFRAELENNDNGEPIAITILDRRGRAMSNNGNLLFRNVEAGDTQTLTASGLAEGEYFVRLQSVNGRDENYRLRLSGSDSGTNGSSDSRSLGQLVRGRNYRYTGTVGGQDIDRYQFSLDSRSRFTTSLFNDSDDAIAVSILDRNNQVVQTSNGRFLFGNADPGRSVELFAPTLPAGSYTVRVQSAVGSREAYEINLQRSSLFV